MQALLWNGTTARVVSRDEPPLAPGRALVRMTRAGICNTDLEIAKGYMSFRGVLGHELVGVVVEGPDAWRGRRVVAEIGNVSALTIGGKSLGGRMATMVADELGVKGVVCFGYPFHPPADPTRLRTAHLGHLTTPTLILQGSRDPFGTREQVGSYQLASSVRIEWLEDGDHSLKPRRSSGATEAEHTERAIRLAAAFVESSR